ncbi:acyl-CoA thioesterase/bile acid-CoA:amino acid N-acyltransferase family protein [Natranaeroarchaeum aerophilus]|uniref:Acyl-CoA thioesterase/BAAT N-terminal domain-containing protein n=1 Tax=Natranaeroarchaeum aerophilus TaxID=2917711 RepID=A0AAE3K4X8_9EURY|nr:acyl-CoA thioester hydrolase/BAAT C-terminal domain-containing protein [Natranaeroarchaeum aerophilus]MCL9813506.1 acyl-CoA thioesterase/BAAT N-terminal domain-containing protein [Natranaeroarchaeum aerophilus]
MDRNPAAGGRRTRRTVLGTIVGGGLAALAGCAGLRGGGATIESKSEPLVDEALDLRVTGLDAEQTVTVVAAMELAQGGVSTVFRSRAMFQADEDGVVDPSDTAPIEGTYDAADPMGIVWSMIGGLDLPLDPPSVGESEGRTQPVTVAVYGGEEQLASRQIPRVLAPTGIEQREPDDDDLVIRAALPEGAGPHPGVLVLHGGDGQPPGQYALQLAANGIAACVVQYFGDHQAIPDEQVHVPMEYFDRAVDWFSGLDSVTSEVGAVGFSLGGTVAQLLGVRRDDIGVVVPYSTIPYVFGFSQFDGSPFSDSDEPLPYVELPWTESEFSQDQRRTRPAIEAGFGRASEEQIEAARIPVEEIDAPVLYVTGEDDTTAPATEYTDRAIDWLDSAEYAHEYEHLAYEDAGHSIFAPYSPTPDRVAIDGRQHGGTPAGIAAAEAESWPVVLDYLRSGLEK